MADGRPAASATARRSRPPTSSSPARDGVLRPSALDADGGNLRAVDWRARSRRRRRVAELWDGETLAGWRVRRHRVDAPQLHDRAARRGGATPANAGVLWFYGARQFKDFELSVDYRAAATNSNGGVLLRFPRPAAIADADRNGYQVAVLDNGTAATRSGALLQERPGAVLRAVERAAAKPTREWNTLDITRRRARTSPCASTACGQRSTTTATRNGAPATSGSRTPASA